MPNLLSDEDLLKSYQLQQEQQVLANLFLRYSSLAYGVCIKYLKDQEAARDAVMNIYEELVEKLKHHKIESFKNWLYVYCRNHCLMQLRKQKKMPIADLSNDVMQFNDFDHLDEILGKEKKLTSMENCIEQLIQNQKTMIQLFYLENKSYKEISQDKGLEWNTVRSLIQNGRRNLKICMEKHEE